MFTDLSFLDVNKHWAPNNAAFKERQDNYITGRQLYEGDFNSAFNDVWEKISRRYDIKYTDDEQVMVAVRLFRTLTETFKLLAFEQMPDVTPEMDKKQLQEFVNKMQECFISAHAQGDGVFKVYSTRDGQYKIGSINPELWIPVYYPDNLDEVQYHVVANTYDVNNETTNWVGDTITTTKRYLNVEIHRKGGYEWRLYELDIDTENIKTLIDSKDVKFTKWNDFAVFPFNFGTPNFRDYGVSQYTDLIPLIEELVVRLSNASKILDDHSDPWLVAPDTALEMNVKTGQREVRRHKALIKNRKDEADPMYLTWDGNLDANEKQMDRIMQLFHMVAGSNPQMFGIDIAGNLSGDALAKILLVPLAKVNMMLRNEEQAAESAYNCWLALNNKAEDADIVFKTGMFNQPSDISERVVSEYGAGVISLENAVEELNPSYDEKQIAEEVQRIKDGVDVNSMDSVLGRPQQNQAEEDLEQ